MTDVKIIPPRSRCRLVAGDRGEVTVLAAEIREYGVARYEVVWWHNGSRSTAWVEPHEIESLSTNPPARVIGFGGSPQ